MAAGAGAAAVEAPALAYLVIALAALISLLVLRGLRFTWVFTIGFLLGQIAKFLRFSLLGYHVDLGGWAASANGTVMNFLDRSIAQADGAVGYFMHGAATLALWGLREVEHYAAESLAWADFMQRVHLPRWVKWAIYAAVPPLIAIRIADYARTHVIPKTSRITRVIVKQAGAVAHGNLRPIERDIAKLRHAVGGLSAVVAVITAGEVWPRALPGLSIPNVWRGLTKRMARAERRLRRLEALLGAGGLAVAMSNVLGIANPNCLRRGPLGKFSRALCGLSGQILNDILSLLVDAAILGLPCKTMGFVQDAANFILPTISGFATDIGAAFDECGYNEAAKLTVAPGPLPPLQTDLQLGV